MYIKDTQSRVSATYNQLSQRVVRNEKQYFSPEIERRRLVEAQIYMHVFTNKSIDAVHLQILLHKNFEFFQCKDRDQDLISGNH